MRATRELIKQTIQLREDELDLAEKEALYESATLVLLESPTLLQALGRIRVVWSTVHTSAEKRRRGIEQ